MTGDPLRMENDIFNQVTAVFFSISHGSFTAHFHDAFLTLDPCEDDIRTSNPTAVDTIPSKLESIRTAGWHPSSFEDWDELATHFAGYT